MKTLLSKVQASDVIAEPFPHIVIKDALDEDLCAKLVAEYPSIDTLSQSEDNQPTTTSSNIRYHYTAKDTLNDEQISPLWKEFIQTHTSNAFLKQFINVFKEPILHLYPNFEQIYGSFELLTSGVRKIDTLDNSDVLLDTLICVNTPVTTRPTSVRGSHLDLADKLFAGLFYLRDPQDDSTGGDLELYCFKKGRIQGFRNSEITSSAYVERVKTIEYERNCLVLFINSIHSLHGVSPRSLTKHPRYFVNLVGEVKHPLFNISKYQEANHIKYWKKVKKLINTFQ
ncbi:2OG-Fe(II) oxygenase [Gloeocapsa sp. BRSZ]